jgi:Tfp pilus assembly protein PilN
VRPVNLIPPEDRRGDAAPLRTGPAAYVVLGVAALALLMVTPLVTTGNSIKDREAELDSLEAREQAATAAAAALTPYTQFASMATARDQTVTSLAQSRFDWERVLRELSLILPDGVWVTQVSASSAAGAGGDTGGSSPLSAGVTGPVLSLNGCATGQKAVAELTAALHDIDGVTRVGLGSSQLGTGGSESDGSESGGSGSVSPDECQTETISKFEVVAAFDAVQSAAATTTTPPADTPATDPATADGIAEEQAAKDSATKQTDRSRNAANLVPGVDQ